MRSRAGSEIGVEMGLDMEPLARLVRRMRGRRKERGPGELRRLLDQADQRRRVLRHPDHLDLVGLDPQLRHIGAVGQRLRNGFTCEQANDEALSFGQIGRGKSSFVKSYLWRQAVFGRRAWVVDPKGEYGPLARAWGVAPVALYPGGSVRLKRWASTRTAWSRR